MRKTLDKVQEKNILQNQYSSKLSVIKNKECIVTAKRSLTRHDN